MRPSCHVHVHGSSTKFVGNGQNMFPPSRSTLQFVNLQDGKNRYYSQAFNVSVSWPLLYAIKVQHQGLDIDVSLSFACHWPWKHTCN